MSKRAEEAALRAYPKGTRDKTGFVTDIGHPQFIRDYYIQGYEQAEKDLALTWQDMVKVVEIVGDLGNRSDFALRGGTTGGIQPFYEEVLSRFNSQREKK